MSHCRLGCISKVHFRTRSSVSSTCQISVPLGRRSSICADEAAKEVGIYALRAEAGSPYTTHPPYSSPVLKISNHGCLCMLSFVRRYAQYKANGPPMKTVNISSETTVESAFPHRTSACRYSIKFSGTIRIVGPFLMVYLCVFFPCFETFMQSDHVTSNHTPPERRSSQSSADQPTPLKTVLPNMLLYRKAPSKMLHGRQRY